MLLDAISFNEFIAWIAGIVAILFAFLTSFAVLFAAITTWYGFKYRRDSNLSLRKDYHISISETYNKFIANIDNPEDMINESYDLKLLGYFSSPLSQKRKGVKLNLGKTTNVKLRNLLLTQFKNWESIEDDFQIKKNLNFNDFALKMGLIEEKIIDRKELIKILTLLNIALLTDSIHMIKNTGEYNHIIKFIVSFNTLSPARTRKLVSNLTSKTKSKSEKQDELDKFKSEIEAKVDESDREDGNEIETKELDTNEKLIESLEKDNISATTTLKIDDQEETNNQDEIIDEEDKKKIDKVENK